MAKGGAGFSHAVRNFAGRSAPPWRPCLGGRLGAAARGATQHRWARTATARGSGAQGSSVPGCPVRSSALCLVGGSEFSRSGRTGGARGCPLQMRGALFAPSSSCPGGARVGLVAAAASAVRALAERPRPTAGAAGGWGEARGILLHEFGLPHPARTPGSVRCRRRRGCENHFTAAQPVPPAPAGGGGGGAARTGTGKEVTFKPRARGDARRAGVTEGSGVHPVGPRECRRAGGRE